MSAALSALSSSSLPIPAMPAIDAGAAITTGATYSAAAARNLGLVQAPVSAAARGLATVSPLQTAARFLSRTLSFVVIGASAMQGARIVEQDGYRALIHTREGRGAVLGTVGGALLLIPTPATQLGGAAVLAVSAANEFGLFRRIDRPTTSTAAATGRVSTATTTALAASTVAAAAAGGGTQPATAA